MDLKDHIRGIPDFPKPGILFYDISTLLRDADAWQVAMGRLARIVRVYQPDLVAGIESRGFLMAAPLALKLGCGFIMLRKRGKLPGEVVGHDYALEYGTDRIEIQADSLVRELTVFRDGASVSGSIASIDIDKRQVHLRDDTGKDVFIGVPPETVISLQRSPARLEELRPQVDRAVIGAGPIFIFHFPTFHFPLLRLSTSPHLSTSFIHSYYYYSSIPFISI